MQIRKRLDHRFAQRRMSEYVDGELSARQRRRIARHADECPECGPLRRSLTRLVMELRTLRATPPDGVGVAPMVIEHVRAAGDPRGGA